jgi:hypothetical protein
VGQDPLILSSALALAAAAVGPVEIGRPLTVAEVWAKHRELNGATFQISGVLKGCGRTQCILAEGSGAGAKWLGVDLSSERKFDTEQLLRHRIVVEGRFIDACLPADARAAGERATVICVDQTISVFAGHIVETP